MKDYTQFKTALAELYQGTKKECLKQCSRLGYSKKECESYWCRESQVTVKEKKSVHERVNESRKAVGADYDQAAASSAIDAWKQDMSRLEDHIEFLKRKHKGMGTQLADAQKRYKAGDYLGITQNLYTLGDLY